MLYFYIGNLSNFAFVKNRLNQEITNLKQQNSENLTTINRKNIEIQELKKEENNLHDKLKEQSHELHTLKTDRNLLSKNLTDTKVSIFIFYDCL